MIVNVNGEKKELNYIVNGTDKMKNLIEEIEEQRFNENEKIVMNQDQYNWWTIYLYKIMNNEKKDS